MSTAAAGDAPTGARVGLHRRAAWATAAAAAALFVVLAAVLVPWAELRPVPVRADDVARLFTPDEVARAEEYATVRRVLGLASYAVSLLVALGLGLTRAGARLVRAVGGRRWWLAVPAGTLAVLLVGRLATLGFAVAIRRRNLAYGLTEQTWAGWAGDYLRSLGMAWMLTSLVLLVLVATARRSPRLWFAWAGGFAVALTAVGSFLYPVVVEPVFNRFTPLEPGPLRSSVLRLADEVGVEVEQVLVADASRRTTTLNAYVSGFGDTRRVVVYDTLVDGLTPEEARVVVAHELAHARHDDVLVGTGLGAVAALLGVALLALAVDSAALRRRSGTAGAQDPAAVPLVLALAALGAFVAAPVQSTLSRVVETRADQVALRTTADPESFVAMQRVLALRALSDPTPPRLTQWWFGTHPTVLERVAMARATMTEHERETERETQETEPEPGQERR